MSLSVGARVTRHSFGSKFSCLPTPAFVRRRFCLLAQSNHIFLINTRSRGNRVCLSGREIDERNLRHAKEKSYLSKAFVEAITFEWWAGITATNARSIKRSSRPTVRRTLLSESVASIKKTVPLNENESALLTLLTYRCVSLAACSRRARQRRPCRVRRWRRPAAGRPRSC